MARPLHQPTRLGCERAEDYHTRPGHHHADQLDPAHPPFQSTQRDHSRPEQPEQPAIPLSPRQSTDRDHSHQPDPSLSPHQPTDRDHSCPPRQPALAPTPGQSTDRDSDQPDRPQPLGALSPQQPTQRAHSRISQLERAFSALPVWQPRPVRLSCRVGRQDLAAPARPRRRHGRVSAHHERRHRLHRPDRGGQAACPGQPHATRLQLGAQSRCPRPRWLCRAVLSPRRSLDRRAGDRHHGPHHRPDPRGDLLPPGVDHRHHHGHPAQPPPHPDHPPVVLRRHPARVRAPAAPWQQGRWRRRWRHPPPARPAR